MNWKGAGAPLVDAHVHLHEDPSMSNEVDVIVAVSDDLESSKKTLEMNAIKCIGVHPWSVEEASEKDLIEIESLIENADCLGEVGLDNRYVRNKEKARRFFEAFLRMSREYDVPLNLHALDAWREVFDLLIKYDIKRAYFHWYNGPLDLLEEIVGQGYFIGINAAIDIQRKHLKVLQATPLKAILTESDGPYNYRGVVLRPSRVRKLIGIISSDKGVSEEDVKNAVFLNLVRWLGKYPRIGGP